MSSEVPLYWAKGGKGYGSDSPLREEVRMSPSSGSSGNLVKLGCSGRTSASSTVLSLGDAIAIYCFVGIYTVLMYYALYITGVLLSLLYSK